jgi:hypothetical protein
MTPGLALNHFGISTRGIARAHLLKTMIDPATPASVRVRAAECVMNQATKAIEIEDIEARVAALEKEAQATEQTR